MPWETWNDLLPFAGSILALCSLISALLTMLLTRYILFTFRSARSSYSTMSVSHMLLIGNRLSHDHLQHVYASQYWIAVPIPHTKVRKRASKPLSLRMTRYDNKVQANRAKLLTTVGMHVNVSGTPGRSASRPLTKKQTN